MTATAIKLSILAYPDGFIFYETANNGLQTYKLEINANVDFPDALEEFVLTQGWNEINSKITINEHVLRFAIFPSEIKSENEIRKMFDFIYSPITNNTLITSNLSDNKQQICFEIPQKRIESYNNIFKQYILNSDSQLISEFLINKTETQKEQILFCNIYKKGMQIFISQENKIIFANSFGIKSTEEITYFVLRCIEQLNLDPFKIECNICSDVETRKAVIESLRPYLKNLKGEKIINVINALT